MSADPPPGLDRRAVVVEMLRERGELLVISGLGSPSWDTFAAGDHDANFYLWGAMGSAVTIGLGLARARPNCRVLVITGDGELLMGLGALATIGVKRPANLTIAVLDNGRYGETGMQLSHAGLGTDLCAIARACQFEWTREVRHMADVGEVRGKIHGSPSGPGLARIHIDVGRPQAALPPRDGVLLKNRFRAALCG
jgi:thiamine pyrophosphate-dependent acetolactate synthase large subunit-like protein